MNTNDYEIFRKINYKPFENNGKKFLLSDYPYLDIVMHDHCQAKCKFCIAKLVHKKQMANFEQQKEKILYAVDKLGVREVLLLGGEPTLNPRLLCYLKFLRDIPEINKICLTTNGFKLQEDGMFMAEMMDNGLTHLNISIMNKYPSKQFDINQYGPLNPNFLYELKDRSERYDIKIRINTNVFLDNNDSLEDMIDFYEYFKIYADSIKFSPLLKTDSFSTVNEVTEFNHKHLLSDSAYDSLWQSIESHYSDYPIVRNKETFGFVEYSMIMKDVPIILNYNQHGKLREKVIKEGKINNLKLLPTGDLSLSWNREEKEYFINTERGESVK